MKMRLWMIFPILVVLLFTGCACEHEWMAANCLNPQTCTKCEEIGEPALGHDWLDATCTAPETCARCSESQGQPLGHDWISATCTTPETCARCSETRGETLAHSYDDWIFGDELMSHTCSVCNYFEELPIDRELYLESLIVGYWDCWSVYAPNQREDFAHYVDHPKEAGVDGDNIGGAVYYWTYDGSASLQFREDYTFTLKIVATFTGGHDNLSGSWAVSEPESDGGFPSGIDLWLTKDFFGDNILHIDCIFSDDGELMLKFDLANTKNANGPEEWAMTFYREKDEMLAGFCGNWGAVTNAFIDESYCVQIRPDRTATCYIEGIYEGTWSLGANPFDRHYVLFNIEYVKDGKRQVFKGYYYHTPDEYHDVPTFTLCGMTRDFDFHEISDEELAIRRGATDLFSGTWTSIGFGSSNPQFADSVTNDYSLTVEKNGGFTLTVPDGKTYGGIWSAYATHEGHWQYYLYFTEQKKQVYCYLDTRGSVATVGIGETTDGELFFKQMREEAFAGPTLPLETWTFEGAYNSKTGKPADTSDCSITFHEDGTFTGLLDREVRGTWKYYQYDESTEYYSDGVEEVYGIWNYRLCIEGETEPKEMRIEKYKNREQFILRISVTDSDGNRTMYVFNRDK